MRVKNVSNPFPTKKTCARQVSKIFLCVPCVLCGKIDFGKVILEFAPSRLASWLAIRD